MDTKRLGVGLIVAGVVTFIITSGLFAGDTFLLLLGVACLAGYVLMGYRRSLLVVGSLLSALAIFNSVADSYASWVRAPLSFLLFGLAFSVVYLVEAVMGRSVRWSLWVALASLGFSGFLVLVEFGYVAPGAEFWRHWPVVLIAWGLWLLAGSVRRQY